jgi:xanthine dehydrogenase large subunit
VPGVRAVLTARDIPGKNDIAPIFHDEPLLAESEVFAVGQAIVLVVGDSYAACRAGARAVVLELEPLPAVLTLRQAVAEGSYSGPVQKMERGDVSAALQAAHLVLTGEVETGGQDHFYLETHVSLVYARRGRHVPPQLVDAAPQRGAGEGGRRAGPRAPQVVVDVPRMGGGFGGKETQGAHFAALAALGARATRRR